MNAFLTWIGSCYITHCKADFRVLSFLYTRPEMAQLTLQPRRASALSTRFTGSQKGPIAARKP